MIYGEILHEEHYYDVFPVLLERIKSAFTTVESGLQGDAYIWVFDNNEKVALDTFTSMRFQIKAANNCGALVEKVLSVLKATYKVYLYEEPEIEGHEDVT